MVDLPNATLCFLVKDDKICLGIKKRKLGKGKYNGFGGFQEGAETIEHTAIRELQEECGVKASTIIKAGDIAYHFTDHPEQNVRVHIFIVTQWEGEPKESNEITAEWFDLDKIPYEKMWDNDKLWLPRILKGEIITGSVIHTMDMTINTNFTTTGSWTSLQTKRKSHIVIGSYIFHNDKVLLIHHKKLDKWLPVGGHIDEDELPDDAVLREIKEEVGLDAEFIHPNTLSISGGAKRNLAIPFHVNVHSVGDHDHCCYFYAMKAKNTITTQNTKELKAMRWFSREELKEAIVPEDVREIALRAFELMKLNY